MPGSPALDPVPSDATGAGPPAGPGGRGWGRVTLAGAVAALLGFTGAVVLLILPVRVPEVQRCGTPVAYLLGGRVDTIPDQEGRILEPDGEVVTIEPAAASAARAAPCRERVAARAVPAALIGLAAMVVGVLSFAVELFVVRPRRRRDAASRQMLATTTGGSGVEGPPPTGRGGRADCRA